MKFIKTPAVIAIAFLILSFFSWPYSFYTLLRIIVSLSALYYAYYCYESERKTDFWFWILVAIAIIFNPIAPVYIGKKSTWGVLDFLAAISFVSLIIKKEKNGRD